MKKTLLLTIFVFGSLVASAQFVGGGRTSGGSKFFSTEKVDHGVNIGIRGGLNISGFKADVRDGNAVHDFENAAGYKAGIALNIPIVRSMYIETGVYFTSKRVKLDESYKNGDALKYKLTPSFVEIPILASYRYDFNEKLQLQVKLGPYFAYGVTGKLAYDDDDDAPINLFSTTTKIGDARIKEVKRLMKPFDAGICIGAGILFNKHWYAGIEYEFGFVNLVDNKSSWYDGLPFDYPNINLKSVKTHNFSVSIGYDF